MIARLALSALLAWLLAPIGAQNGAESSRGAEPPSAYRHELLVFHAVW
ncbi:MAG: hypothetical protein WD226_07495 [Planctomycetota bacterium]